MAIQLREPSTRPRPPPSCCPTCGRELGLRASYARGPITFGMPGAPRTCEGTVGGSCAPPDKPHDSNDLRALFPYALGDIQRGGAPAVLAGWTGLEAMGGDSMRGTGLGARRRRRVRPDRQSYRSHSHAAGLLVVSTISRSVGARRFPDLPNAEPVPDLLNLASWVPRRCSTATSSNVRTCRG